MHICNSKLTICCQRLCWHSCKPRKCYLYLFIDYNLTTYPCIAKNQARSCNEIIYITHNGNFPRWFLLMTWPGHQGLYSLSGKTSYRKISWSLGAARFGVIMIVSLWNLTGISAALLPRCLSNLRAIGKVQTRISRLRNFTRSCGKTSYRLVNRGPV